MSSRFSRRFRKTPFDHEGNHSPCATNTIGPTGYSGRVQALLIVLCLTIACFDVAAAARNTVATDTERVGAERMVRVGLHRSITRIADAARTARDGDVIEIDAGAYPGDVAVWDKQRLTIRGVNGMVVINAAGASAEKKAIWVIRGDQIVVENIVFSGARVGDRNGAGIRHEQGRLKVVNCRFFDNESGILTGNDPNTELIVERSEFDSNGADDGQAHGLYAGSIKKLTVRMSYFHHGNYGHLIKSRAAESFIMYNRIADGAGGRASYELDFPNGGLTYVIGNVIAQDGETENPVIISFGEETYRRERNELFLINNTIIDNLAEGGTFLRVRAGVDRVRAMNNVLFGPGRLESAIRGEYAANFYDGRTEADKRTHRGYRLRPGSPLIGKAIDPGEANGFSLRPALEYADPLGSRPVPNTPYSPGAFQIVDR